MAKTHNPKPGWGLPVVIEGSCRWQVTQLLAGTDTLLFNGANIGETVTISANGSRALLTRDVGAIAMDMNGVETIHFNALGGADTITVTDMSGTDVRLVDIDLAGIIGDTAGDNQPDTIVINGIGGDDVIQLSLQNGALVVTGLATQIVIEHFDANDTIRIVGLGGDDTSSRPPGSAWAART